MSYTPTNWQSGDIITSAKLNKMEQGIANGGGVLLVTASYDDTSDGLICDKTGDEVKTAFLNGLNVILHVQEENQDRGTEKGSGDNLFESWMLLMGISSGLTDEIVSYNFGDGGLITRLGENDYLMDETYYNYYYSNNSGEVIK